jgi:hypothetical protein
MPFCPICSAEFREGFTRCNTCDVDLVEALEDDNIDLSEEAVSKALAGKDLVVVSKGNLDAVMETRDLLWSKRVLALVTEDKEYVPPKGAPKRMDLVVGKHQLEEAMMALGENFKKMVKEEGLKVEGDLAYENCPACGVKVPEDAEECPECGLVIGRG